MHSPIIFYYYSLTSQQDYQVEKTKKIAQAMKNPSDYYTKRAAALEGVKTESAAHFANQYANLVKLNVPHNEAISRATALADSMRTLLMATVEDEWPADRAGRAARPRNHVRCRITTSVEGAGANQLPIATDFISVELRRPSPHRRILYIILNPRRQVKKPPDRPSLDRLKPVSQEVGHGEAGDVGPPAKRFVTQLKCFTRILWGSLREHATGGASHV